MRLVLLPQMRYKLFGGEPNGETWRSLDRQAVEENRTAVASSTETTKRRATLDRQPVRDRRDPLGPEDGSPVVRSVRGIPESLTGQRSVQAIRASAGIPCQESHGDHKLLSCREMTGKPGDTRIVGPIQPSNGPWF